MASRLVVGDEPRFGVFDTVALGLVPADIGVLDDVFGVSARADHAVRDAEEAAAQRLERRYLRSPSGPHPILGYVDGRLWIL